jgi:hypothetical protein
MGTTVLTCFREEVEVVFVTRRCTWRPLPPVWIGDM